MIAVRIAFSNPRKGAERQRFLDAHKAHLRSGLVRILQSGPLAGSSASGGLVVAEVDGLDAFKSFSDGDPFVLHGVYDEVRVFEWTITLGTLTESSRDRTEAERE